MPNAILYLSGRQQQQQKKQQTKRGKKWPKTMAETKKAKGMCTTFLLKKKKKKKKSLAETVIKTEFKQRQQSCRSTSTTVHKKKFIDIHRWVNACLPACVHLCAAA